MIKICEECGDSTENRSGICNDCLTTIRGEIKRTEIHEIICDELREIYTSKNRDYGNSFAKLRDEYPEAILIRIYDKYSRIKTLLEFDQYVKGESIEDSLMDLANYAIMELIERRRNE